MDGHGDADGHVQHHDGGDVEPDRAEPGPGERAHHRHVLESELRRVRRLLPVGVSFGTARPPAGTHILVLGRDTKIYHKHQIAPNATANWTDWKCLTPDLSQVPCSTAPACGGFDNSPAVAWTPGDNGTAVVFVRQLGDLDIFETHLEDPADPDSWSDLRAPACICNYPPCANQTKCGVALCDEKGVDCSVHPTSSNLYWSHGPLFPTSELSLLVEGDRLALYYRGFDGAYYKSLQEVAGDVGGKFAYPPTRLGGFSDNLNSVIE